tara:strand:+ start:35994 stop:36596 length:603 start_codon:yes stop_codon:yes gene_type:complete
MKQKINIYSEIGPSEFFYQLFPNYKLFFYKIKEIKITKKTEAIGIIFLNQYKKEILKYLQNNQNKNIIVGNVAYEKFSSNNLIFIKNPTPLNKIQNTVKKFISDSKIIFEDVEIVDNKLINRVNKKYCFLTYIENEIFLYLVNEKNLKKEYIKKNILKVKKSIETNSLDSHLTRIRKKLEKIETKIKIQSKNDVLSISSN